MSKVERSKPRADPFRDMDEHAPDEITTFITATEWEARMKGHLEAIADTADTGPRTRSVLHRAYQMRLDLRRKAKTAPNGI